MNKLTFIFFLLIALIQYPLWLSDGGFKNVLEKNKQIKVPVIKSLMTKKPISINKDLLAAKAIETMNRLKITSLCVHKKNKIKTIGIIHIHNILQANIE